MTSKAVRYVRDGTGSVGGAGPVLQGADMVLEVALLPVVLHEDLHERVVIVRQHAGLDAVRPWRHVDTRVIHMFIRNDSHVYTSSLTVLIYHLVCVLLFFYIKCLNVIKNILLRITVCDFFLGNC